jgi:STAM-binding protein
MDGLAERPQRPKSVEEICQEADTFEFQKNVPFKHWLRAAETLFFEVCPCAVSGGRASRD